MWPHTRRRNFPYHSNKDEGSREQSEGVRCLLQGAVAQGRGYALLVVMAVATLLLVSLTVALPSVYQEAQREREEELIFRGIQYARAIAMFHRQFQRFPVSVKELLQTNGLRFLRRAYPDPMDRKGKWRFIHANAAGVLLDSKMRGLPSNAPSPSGTPPMISQTSPGAEASPPNSQSASAFFGSGNEMVGAFIVGVAATSHRESIRVWNNRTHYDEWEFLGVDLNLLGTPAGVPGQSGGPAQPQGVPGFGGQPSGPGTPVSPPSATGPPIPPPQPPPQ
jgi:type II secretory pathway pseudopilin PulG